MACWVDTFAYANADAEILRPATEVTGQQPIVSQDGACGSSTCGR